MDFTAPLMAMSNYETGYLKGVDQAQTRDYVNKFRNLQIGQMQEKSQQDQALADRALQLFSPQVNNPVSGQPINQPSNPPAPPQQPPSPQEMSGKLMQMAKYAYQIGAVDQGNKFATNAMNLNNEMLRQQQTASAISLAELKRRIQSHAYVAQTLGAAQTPEQWDRAKMAILADPMVTPEEKMNLAKLQYSPENVAAIRQSGMTSAQQAQQQYDQQMQQERERHNQVMETNNELRTKAYQARAGAEIQHLRNLKKTGSVGKAPSQQEMSVASASVGQFLTNSGITPDPTDFNYKNIVIDAAGEAKKLVLQNKGLTYPDAVNMALEGMQKRGELKVVKPVKGFFHTTQGSVEELGSQQKPIPLNTVAGEEDVVPNKYYTQGGKVYKAGADKRFHLVQ